MFLCYLSNRRSSLLHPFQYLLFYVCRDDVFLVAHASTNNHRCVNSV
jgi:hypothetical protein